MNKKEKFPNIHPVVLRAVLILFITAIFSALVFETIHSEHEIECHEDNCPVCLILQIIHNTQKTSVPTQAASFDFLFFFYINILILSAVLLVPATLVKQKIKLVI
ncbi:MAG: hypothetical protein K5640_03375 [Treponema sp.]|nr:hypothetical protein [Treponema sp.]